MGGPFRFVVGGSVQYQPTFAPAQVLELNNYSTQYGHLINSDVFVAPGQIGLRILVDGISAEVFKFEAPPNATQAAPTAGQVCQLRTYEVARPGEVPLQPAVGVLLPIGLDQPQHLHHHPNTHQHGISADATGSSGHSHSHSHTIPNHQHFIPVTNNGGVPAGAQVFYDGVSLNANHTGGGEFGNTDGGGGASSADATGESGHSHSHSHGGQDAAASPGDSALENVQHTHP